jgi:hypoxanthine phosphoribosyltransferase
MSDVREVLKYEGFGTAIYELAVQVRDSGFKPDVIVCIARGGLIVGGALGYALDVKNSITINVEFYTGVGERLEVPMFLAPVPDKVNLAGLKVLIADDVADSGLTLKMVREYCEDVVEEVRTAVIYEKSASVEKPDYSWRHTDLWINFPWSSPGTSVVEAVVADS